jgi:hypothetical protein
MQVILSKKDFVILIKYFIKNKAIFLFTASITEAIYKDKIKIKDEESADLLVELHILLDSFNSEVIELVDLGRRNNYIFIKIPFITIDLTRDIDVISYHNRLEMKTTFFKISFDYYSLERLRHQLNACNFHQLNDTGILKPREFYYFDVKNEFKVEIKKMTVLGFDENIDYCLLVNNIIENGFVLYYDYLNLKLYKIMLKKTINNRIESKGITVFPSSRYPLPLIRPLNLSLSTFTRFVKMMLDNNYTPAYGYMIKYVRDVALNLKLKKLAEVLI